MKLFSTTVLLFIFSFFTYGQDDGWCGTDAQAQKHFALNPELEKQMYEQLERITSGAYAVEERDGAYIIPVVVHVLHDNDKGNISIEQIESGIDMLNEDFNRLNADTSETRNTPEAPFKPIASNMNIKFELAKIDPLGNCTNGIQRRNVGAYSYNADDLQKKYATGGIDGWSRNFYFNIWVVNSIKTDGPGTILGYAQFPYYGSASTYGVIIRNDAYGKLGTASGDRTLTHEVGHCLGLLHTFQNGCHSNNCASNGDFCCDTPPVSEAHWSCNPALNSCAGVPTGDYYGFNTVDQFENFMSYSPCQNMFSMDQKSIVIDNLNTVVFLKDLVKESHYASTGIGLEPILCKAQFDSDNQTICNGQTIQYFDKSYSNVTSRSWTFEGGTPATSTDENPIVTYNSAGNYNVTLEVSDGIANVSTTENNYILVLSNPGTLLPYKEDFEALVAIPDNDRFLIQNQDEGAGWKLSETVGFSGTNSAFLKNHGVKNGSIDELISGTIDLSGVDPADDMVFNFKYAYKKRDVSNDEWLRFYISKDCGKTWALRKNIHGSALNEEKIGTPYTPETKEEWIHVDITNIKSDYYTADFRYKFAFQNNSGNNIYIDDINMYPASMASIITPAADEDSFGFSAYPNPSSNDVILSYTVNTVEEISIVIFDMLGQHVQTIFSGSSNPGLNTATYSIADLTAGIYQVTLTNGTGKITTLKLIKE